MRTALTLGKWQPDENDAEPSVIRPQADGRSTPCQSDFGGCSRYEPGPIGKRARLADGDAARNRSGGPTSQKRNKYEF